MREFSNSQISLLPEERIQSQSARVELVNIDFEYLTNLSPAFLQSVEDHGILQSVALIRRGENELDVSNKPFYVAAGRRRLTAASMVGIEVVPALVFPPGTPIQLVHAISLIENTQRGANPVSEFEAIRSLVLAGATEQDICVQLAIPASLVRRRLQLGNLLGHLFSALRDGRMAVTTAERISRLPGNYQRPLSLIAQSGREVTIGDYRDMREIMRQEAGSAQESIPGTGPTREAIDAPGVSGRGTDILGREFIVIQGQRWILEAHAGIATGDAQEPLRLSMEALESMETWEAVQALLEAAQRTLPVEADDVVDDIMEQISMVLTSVSVVRNGSARRSVQPT